MITKEKAIENAENFIKKRFIDSEWEIVVDINRIVDTEDAWFVDYQSKKFIETKNPAYFVVIRSLIRVDKDSGECILQSDIGND